MNIFISGIGSGLGKAIASFYLQEKNKVYAIGKKIAPSLKEYNSLYFKYLDLNYLEKIETALRELIDQKIDIAFLNAAVLGKIETIEESSIKEINDIYTINVWANKIILDYFLTNPPKLIIAISSGASISGARGWSSYALSKSSLNMLIKLYSHEFKDTKLYSLAPGLIDTPMLKSVLKEDQEKFPVIKRLITSPKMTPKEAAKNIIEKLDFLQTFPSGEYIDIRKI